MKVCIESFQKALIFAFFNFYDFFGFFNALIETQIHFGSKLGPRVLKPEPEPKLEPELEPDVFACLTPEMFWGHEP